MAKKVLALTGKGVILNEEGNIVADATVRSKINPVETANLVISSDRMVRSLINQTAYTL